MSKQGIKGWKPELERLLASVGDRDAGEVMQEIHSLAVEMGDDAAEALLEQHPYLLEQARPLAEANLQRIEDQNVAEVRQLLERPSDRPRRFVDVASDISLNLYNRVGEVLEHMDFGNCHCVVMVGCGRIPFTNLYLHDHTDVPELIGLDNRPEVVEMSNALTAWLGCKRIRAELAEGSCYDYRSAQVVLVSNYVLRKSAVVSRIADTAPANVKVVVRVPFSLGRLWAESGEPIPHAGLEVVSRGSGSSQLSRGLYLRRRGMSQPR